MQIEWLHKRKSAEKAAILITLAIVVYLVLANLIMPASKPDDSKIALTSDKPLAALLKTETMQASKRQMHLVLYGSTEANRVVKLKAQTESAVEEVVVREGSAVKAGDVILRLEQRDRAARLAQAKALLEQRRVESEAAQKLFKTGAQSEVRVKQSLAQFEEAKTLLASATVDFNNTRIVAPFSGIVETVSVEVGDLVGRGFVVNGDDSVATIVEHDPLVVTSQVPQQRRNQLQKGAKATVKLIDEATIVEGTIRFIGSVTDPATRSFRVEIEIPNPESKIPVGLSAELRLPTEEADAYLVSPSALSLDDKGNVGVKLLDETNTVRFHIVNLLEDGSDGVWVGGLPASIRLITAGQNYVSDGQKLNEDALSSAEK